MINVFASITYIPVDLITVNVPFAFVEHNKIPAYTWEKDIEEQKKNTPKSKL